MKIVIAGGSGFIGMKLTSVLLDAGHEVIILTRGKDRVENGLTYVQWLTDGAAPEKTIQSADTIINLAGVSINDGRWTKQHKKRIYDSRMVATDELNRIINTFSKPPSTYINASAIGIYPPSHSKIYTELSTEVADDFLAHTVRDWESKASTVQSEEIRVVKMRFGVVLGEDGGALPLMTLPYKLFVGGTVGTGQQWVSWVHVDDVIRAILFVMNNQKIHDVVNVTSPFPKRMKYFGQAIGTTLKKPHWMPVPSFMMKIALGEKSKLVLQGQYVSPAVLTKNGFEFKFPILEQALQDLLLPKV